SSSELPSSAAYLAPSAALSIRTVRTCKVSASCTTPSTSAVTSTETSRKSTSADPRSWSAASSAEDTVHRGLEHLAECIAGEGPDEHHQPGGHQRDHHPAGHIAPLRLGSQPAEGALPPAPHPLSTRSHPHTPSRSTGG